MGCGSTCVKIILFIANVIFSLAAIALVALGVVGLLGVKENGMFGGSVEVACIVITVIGVIAFVISFLGCCGAIMENRPMLITYSVLLIVLLILKTALAVLIFVTTTSVNFKAATHDMLRELFNDRERSPAFGRIEQALKCCGLSGSSSYLYIPPTTCCPASDHTCSERNVFRTGCAQAASDLIDHFAVIVGSVCCAIVAVELVAATFGFCLASHLNSRHKGRY